MANYSSEERSILRLANEFRELTESKFWQEYVKILDHQIADREQLLLLPISEQHPKFEGMDFTTRAASLETIKGAIIGLRLAKSIPTATISHASDIVRDHSPEGIDEDAA